MEERRGDDPEEAVRVARLDPVAVEPKTDHQVDDLPFHIRAAIATTSANPLRRDPRGMPGPREDGP